MKSKIIHRPIPTVLSVVLISSILFYSSQNPLLIAEPEEPKDEMAEEIFSNLSLNAKSFVVYDLAKNKEIFGLNSEDSFPLASLTKLMTTVVVAENISSDQLVQVSQQEADVLIRENIENIDINYLINKPRKVGEIEKMAIISSLNGNMAALAATTIQKDRGNRDFSDRSEFVSLMNNKAKELELSSLQFLNETGLDVSDRINGGYGSAKDVARLFGYAIQKFPEILYATSKSEFVVEKDSGEIEKIVNTNPFVSKTTGLVASKTGFTDLTGGNLALIIDVDIGHNIAIVVLGSTKEGRFEDVSKLVKKTIQYFYEK